MSFQGLSTLVYPITNSFPPRKYLADRDPTSADFRNFVLFDEWINKTNESIWIMVGKTATSGTWAHMGTPQIAIDEIAVDANTAPGTDPVTPDGGGLVTMTGAQVAAGVVGANVIRTDSLAANSLTIEIQRSAAVGATASVNNGVSHFNNTQFTVDGNGFVSLVGGSMAIDSVNVDASTPPGTDPVLPSVTGEITVTGGQVASGTIGANVIRTDSLAANTYTIEIQRSNTAAAPDSTLNGVAHFNSADFTVDADGFVSTTGTGMLMWQTIDASQTLVVNNGYMCIAPGGALALLLPATAAIGDILEVTLDGSTSFTITQAAGQQIRYNNLETTLGVVGTLGSTDQGNTIRMVAQTATRWNVISALGTLTVV